MHDVLRRFGQCRLEDFLQHVALARQAKVLEQQLERVAMSGIADRFVIKLARHARLKKMLSTRESKILHSFCAQMRGEGLSDAQLGLKYELPGRNKARAWQDEVKRVGERLSALS